MKCPCCLSPLHITHKDYYSSSYTDGFQCINSWCIANNLCATWTSEGELFIDPPEQIRKIVAIDTIKKQSIYGLEFAVDSWLHKFQLKNKFADKSEKKIHFLNWLISIKNVFTINDNIIKKEFLKWDIKLYKKANYNYYVNVIPFWTMSNFIINQFIKNYQLALKGGSHAIKSCYEDAYQLRSHLEHTKNNYRVDNRFYKKIASIWILIFHKKKVKKIEELYKALQDN